MASKNAAQIAGLAGRSGAQILPFGVDVIPAPSQRHVFAKRLLAILGTSHPVCVGYHVGSDKTTIFYAAETLDWSKGGLEGEVTEMLALHFYRPPNSATPWKLVWASPITWEGIHLYGDHSPC
jgi:hypothetical protein